jgi:hypothetical protein
MKGFRLATGCFAVGAAVTVMACSGSAPSQEEGSVSDTELADSTLPIIWGTDVGLATPESVRWDEHSDEYIVANINGGPADLDNNGFISRLNPNGTVIALKWIEGGVNGVTLNGPKGTALLGNRLWVADIDTVRAFNRFTGEPIGSVQIPGAQFLNDVVIRNGKVLVTDSGLDATITPAGGDAVYQVDQAFHVTTISKTTDLHLPNGIEVVCNKTWVVTFGSNELYSVASDGSIHDVQNLPAGTLDGIVVLDNGNFLISSWETGIVYRGKPGGTFTPVVTDVPMPADIGYDFNRHRVLVPLFGGNEVHSYRQN